MHCSRRTLRKIEYLISRCADAVMIAGTIYIFGAVGNMDYATEAHIPDDPHTMPLLITGFVFMSGGYLYKRLIGEL